ncbi:hypothetical protein [Sporosarcina sp. OR05]|uniref:hypothetical protein n=1 Tax=Sporosarcina sp. OR05 TaxID=2969819 RepID=UPI00352A8A8B
MQGEIVANAKQILKGVQYDFELAFDWDEAYYEPYYKYFSHPDIEVRKYSLLIFVGGLGNWRLESGHIFKSTEEMNKINPDEKQYKYCFEDYIRSFLKYKESIKQEFPLLYSRILWYLLWLDNRRPFDSIFTSVDSQLFAELRYTLTASGVDASKFQENFLAIIEEVGLTHTRLK